MTEDATPPAPTDPKGNEGDAAPTPPSAADTPEPAAASPELPVAAPASRPNYYFLAIVSILSLALDLGTKFWAKSRLGVGHGPNHRMVLVPDHLSLVIADNPGGAFGLLGRQPEWLRRPFFLIISVLAIIFIVSLYRRLTPQQTALKWGLPLVLGGALGNLVNRIQYNSVIDFIDFRADWVRSLQGLIWSEASDHWPTFNVADIAICVGVGLMAIDMFTSRKPVKKAAEPPAPPTPPVTEGT